MISKDFKISLLLALISGLVAYWLLDTSKLFYCLNIGWVTFLFVALIINATRKLKWSSVRSNGYIKIVFVIIFFCLISIPVFQQLTGAIRGKALNPKLNEKRVLADYKSFDSNKIDKFPKDYTDYYNDNFGMRSLLISNNNYFKTIHFGISSNSNIIIGNDGWMFYNNSNSLKDHQGGVKLTESELQQIKLNLLARKRYLEGKGIKFYVAFFPDKMGVYPELLPSKYELKDRTRWDQLIDYLKGSGIDIIDSRNAMKAAKENIGQLYQKSDTHWNHNGGYVASTQIIKRIKKDFPSIHAPFKLEDYEVKEELKRDGGDLSNMLGVKQYLNKEWFHYALKNDKDPKSREDVKDYNIYKEPYKTTFVFNKKSKGPRLLVFNDSFVSYIYPHLADYFSRSAFFWTYDFRKDLIEKEKPDIVLSMLVERQIMRLAKGPLN